MSYTIVVADKFPQEALDLLSSSSHHILQGLEHLAQADALLIRSVPIGQSHIQSAPKLKIIARAGVGMDAIDVAFADSKGIVCVNAPGANAVYAAEHTMGLMLSMAHHIARSHHQILNHIWDRTTTEGFELAGKSLGVVGCGNVGSRVCCLARAFGMSVYAFDPYISQFPEGVQVCSSLNQLLSYSDILTLHVPLTKETKQMIAHKELSLLKENACLINVSRGEVVVLDDLIQYAPHLKAIALDVYPTEPLPQDSSLRSLAHVTLTPHLGGAGKETRLRVAMYAVDAVLKFLEE